MMTLRMKSDKPFARSGDLLDETAQWIEEESIVRRKGRESITTENLRKEMRSIKKPSMAVMTTEVDAAAATTAVTRPTARRGKDSLAGTWHGSSSGKPRRGSANHVKSDSEEHRNSTGIRARKFSIPRTTTSNTTTTTKHASKPVLELQMVMSDGATTVQITPDNAPGPRNNNRISKRDGDSLGKSWHGATVRQRKSAPARRNSKSAENNSLSASSCHERRRPSFPLKRSSSYDPLQSSRHKSRTTKQIDDPSYSIIQHGPSSTVISHGRKKVTEERSLTLGNESKKHPSSASAGNKKKKNDPLRSLMARYECHCEP